MILRTLLTTTLTLLAALSSFAGDKPNFLIFLTDDFTQEDLPMYGGSDVVAPNFSKLATEGMTFNRAFVASPACAPSRAAMLTGLMPTRNGAKANHTYKRPEIPSLPLRLKKLGYEVVAFGKVAHGKDAKTHGFDLVEKTYTEKVIRQFLNNRDDSKPLCLFVGTKRPHVPWPANDGYDPDYVNLPPTHVDTTQTRNFRARYYTDITEADKEFAYTRELAEEFLGKDTVTIFTADHGGQWPFAKWNLYDAGIMVPFIASWPGKIDANSRSNAMISWIDLIPTLIDIAGGKEDGSLDGRSFKSVLLGKKKTHRYRIFTLHDNDGRANVYPIRSVRTQDFKYIRNLQPDWIHTTHSYRFRKSTAGAYWWSWDTAAEKDPSAKAIVDRYHSRPYEELYDLRYDPYEQYNLANDPKHANLLAQLRQEVDDWMTAHGDDGKVTIEPWAFGDHELVKPDTDPENWK